jgi:hypothetical protein
MLVSVGGCSPAEADEQTMIAVALRQAASPAAAKLHLTRRRRDDLAFGTDMARVQLQAGAGCAVVVCVDTDGQRAHPRVLVTLLLLNEQSCLKQDVGLALEQTKMAGGCSLHGFFESLPKLWTAAHLQCVRECLLMM